MKFPGAHYGLKMHAARTPNASMASAAVRRHGWATWRLSARHSSRRRPIAAMGHSGTRITRETSRSAVSGTRRSRWCCAATSTCTPLHRADEMDADVDLAHEFGFKIRSFHHAVEAYKIADALAREGTASSIWSDWVGLQGRSDGRDLRECALLQQAGARVVIHSTTHRNPAPQSGSGEGDVPRSPRGDSDYARPGSAVVYGRTRRGRSASTRSSAARTREDGGRRALVGGSVVGDAAPFRSTTTGGWSTIATIPHISPKPTSPWGSQMPPCSPDDRESPVARCIRSRGRRSSMPRC